MNILPFVAIFLVLLGLFSSSFLTNASLFLSEKKSSIGFLEAERALLGKLHSTTYKKVPKKKTEPKEKKEAPFSKEAIEDLDSIEVTKSSREQTTLERINLYPLFKENLNPLLKKLYLNFFKMYYSHASFYQNSSLANDLNSFVEKIRKEGLVKLKEIEKNKEELSSLSFVDFYPKGVEEEALYYKFLKGTYTYDISTKTGYPPLQKVFCFFRQENEKIFSFNLLTKEMLECLFGEAITKDILQKEQELLVKNPKRNPKTLRKDELKELLHKNHPTFKDGDAILEYLDPGKTSSKEEEIIVIEKESNIMLKQIL